MPLYARAYNRPRSTGSSSPTRSPAPARYPRHGSTVAPGILSSSDGLVSPHGGDFCCGDLARRAGSCGCPAPRGQVWPARASCPRGRIVSGIKAGPKAVAPAMRSSLEAGGAVPYHSRHSGTCGCDSRPPPQRCYRDLAEPEQYGYRVGGRPQIWQELNLLSGSVDSCRVIGSAWHA